MRSIRSTGAGFWASAAAVVPAGAALAQPLAHNPRYIGSPGAGYSTVAAHALNNAGEVVGETAGPSGFPEAFHWAGGTFTLVGSGRALDINDAGLIVGADGLGRGFRVAGPAGDVVSLHTTLEGEWIYSTPHAVNDAGVVAGNVSNAPPTHAAVWHDLLVEDISASDGREGSFNAVSDVGVCAGWVASPDGTHHACVAVGTLMEDLGVIDGDYSEALDINGSGDIVGWSQSGGFTHAFVWLRGEGMIDLTPDAFAASANAINEDGDIVGYVYDPLLSMNRAVLWPATGGVVDLNGTLPVNSGWTLTGATDINDHGQIVGVGRYAGDEDYDRSFLLTPSDCLADINGDGILNVFDFLDFLTAFNDEHPRADMAPAYGVFNVFDFLEFQTAFGEGC